MTAAEAPELYAMVDRQRQRAGLPMPTVAIAPQAQPNAFATGRNPEHAVVCVTAGLLQVMRGEELEGVIAHELAHIKNRDMLLSTIAATMAGAISSLAQFGFFFGGGYGGGGYSDDDDDGPSFMVIILVSAIVWVVSFFLMRMLSRYREFAADRGAAVITGRPSALSSAPHRTSVGGVTRDLPCGLRRRSAR